MLVDVFLAAIAACTAIVIDKLAARVRSLERRIAELEKDSLSRSGAFVSD